MGVPVNVKSNYWVRARPARVRDHSLEEAVNGEVEITVVFGNGDGVGRQARRARILRRIILLVIPVVGVTLIITIVSDLEIVEAVYEVGAAYEEDSLGLRGCWVHSVRHLRNIVSCPRCVILIPALVVVGNAPRIPHHVQLVVHSGAGLELEGCDEGVGVELSHATIV